MITATITIGTMPDGRIAVGVTADQSDATPGELAMATLIDISLTAATEMLMESSGKLAEAGQAESGDIAIHGSVDAARAIIQRIINTQKHTQ
jgi:hypothetical protein